MVVKSEAGYRELADILANFSGLYTCVWTPVVPSRHKKLNNRCNDTHTEMWRYQICQDMLTGFRLLFWEGESGVRTQSRCKRMVHTLQSPILGYLHGTHSEGGIWAPYQYHGTMVWKTHTISHSYQYHVTIPYHHTKLSQGVWGPFSKYINYFCRLQYWSIGCHFLWRGSSCFSWDIKLQMEAI